MSHDHQTARAEELPLADPGYEQTAHAMFPYRAMSPEEYAVREGWKWGLCSFLSHAYRDQELQAWLYAFGACVTSRERMEELRNTLLTPDERVALEKERQEYWENF